MSNNGITDTSQHTPQELHESNDEASESSSAQVEAEHDAVCVHHSAARDVRGSLCWGGEVPARKKKRGM